MKVKTRYLFCVCVTPDYGERLVGCRRCHRPPLARARAELGLTTEDARWSDS